MPTNRTPIDRPIKKRFTPAVLSAFRKMQQLEGDPSPWARELWFQHHDIICQELNILEPWRWPAIERPGIGYSGRWPTDPQAQALYLELERDLKLQ